MKAYILHLTLNHDITTRKTIIKQIHTHTVEQHECKPRSKTPTNRTGEKFNTKTDQNHARLTQVGLVKSAKQLLEHN